jgi:hypothetical protein
LRRRLCATAIILFVGPAVMAPRAQQIVPAPAPDRSYKLLRSDEDWSFLRNKNLSSDFWDPIKYIPLRKTDKNWFATFGGEARETWEQIGNDNWGQSPIMNGYLNERYMAYADLHYGPHVRTFLELKSGINSFRAGGPRRIDEKRLDFQSGFLEVGGETSWGSVHARAGRQELEYGSGRLVDVREGPNVRLSFDGFLLRTRTHAWQVDGFAMRPDEDNAGFFDNTPDHSVGFWGVYATGTIPCEEQTLLRSRRGCLPLQSCQTAKVLHRRNPSRGVRWRQASILSRLGNGGPHVLFLSQTRRLSAATETGYRIPTIPLKPRFSAKADISSGDHPATNTLGTF